MSTTLTLNNSSENELFEVIFQRLDETKRIWKTLKSSLSESFLAFDHFGKLVSKGAKQVSSSSGPSSDPSSYCTLTSNFLAWEERASQEISEHTQNCSLQLMETFDEYGEKLESTSTTLNDSAQSIIKQLAGTRQNHAREKVKYEKVCKETEALITEKNKMANDPLVYYSITQQKRIRTRIFSKLQELRQAENALQTVIELMNENQLSLNNALSDVLKTFRVALRTTLANAIEAIRIYHKSLMELFEKSLSESANALKFSEEQKMTEEEYLQEQMSLDDLKKKEIASALAVSGDLFSEIHQKLLANPLGLTDDQIHIYVELLQKRLDVSLAIDEERRKMVKHMKTFMHDLASHCEIVAKQLQKVSKNPFHYSPAFAFSKRMSVLLDPFYNGIGSLGKKFQNFGTFITMKLNVIEGIMLDQRNSLKTYQTNMQKAIKDHMNLRMAIEASLQSQEKMQKKIDETPENDAKLGKLKKEFEVLLVQQVELRGNFRKHAIETARVVVKIESEHKKQENSKLQSFKHIVEGIVGQESCLFMEICSLLKQTNDAIHLENGIEHEIMLVVGQDEKLADCLKYVDGKKGKEIALIFQKLYTPPVEYNLEYDKGQIGNLGWITPEDFIQFDPLQEKREDDPGSNDEDEEETKESNEETVDKGSPGKIEKRFQINTNDKLLGDFTCAVYQKVLRHGWMYVYSNSLCFCSSKIFGDAVLKIPIKDIIKAEKKVITLVFDSALTLVTKHGEIIFTSFFSRDKAWTLIERLRKGEIDLNEEKVDDRSGINPSPIAKIPKSADFEMKKPNQLLGAGISPIREQVVMKKLQLINQNENESDNTGEIRERDQNIPRRSILHKKTISVSVTPRNGIDHNDASQKGSSTPKGNKSIFFEPLQAEIENFNEHEGKPQPQPQSNQHSQEDRIKVLKKNLEEKRRVEFANDFKIIDSCSQLVIKDSFDCSFLRFYNLIFSDQHSEHRGKKFKNFLTWTKESNGDTEITNTQWNPPPPKSIVEFQEMDLEESLKALLKAPGKSSRIFNYTHPVKEQSMFVPKSCPIEEKQNIIWLSMDELIMYSESKSFKVPLSDCFVVRNSFTLKNTEANKCELTWKLGIEFIKSTMFKAKITKSVQDENLEIAQKVVLLMKAKVSEYLKTKNQTILKTKADMPVQAPVPEEVKENAENKIKPSSEVVEEEQIKVDNQKEVQNTNPSLEKKLTEFKTTQDKMSAEIKSLKSWIMLLAITNLFILSLLFFRRS